MSLKALQAQAEDFSLACPVLLPCVTPRSLQDEDLTALAESEGRPEQARLKAFLRDAVSQREASADSSCSVCAAPGHLPSSSTSVASAAEGEDGAGGDGDGALHFTALSTLNFADKTVRICKGGFMCGQCRAVADTWRMVRFSAVRLGPEEPRREQLVRRLCLHLAAVNHAPSHVMLHEDLTITWAQEVWSRAYAMQVVASNISGWRVLGPDGSEVQRGYPGTAVALAQQLLAAGAPSKKRRSVKADDAVPTPKKSAKKEDRRGVSAAAAAAAALPTSHPATPGAPTGNGSAPASNGSGSHRGPVSERKPKRTSPAEVEAELAAAPKPAASVSPKKKRRQSSGAAASAGRGSDANTPAAATPRLASSPGIAKGLARTPKAKQERQLDAGRSRPATPTATPKAKSTSKKMKAVSGS